jgi:hypothetical protein
MSSACHSSPPATVPEMSRARPCEWARWRSRWAGYGLGTAFAIIACTSLIAVALMTEPPKRVLDEVLP